MNSLTYSPTEEQRARRMQDFRDQYLDLFRIVGDAAEGHIEDRDRAAFQIAVNNTLAEIELLDHTRDDDSTVLTRGGRVPRIWNSTNVCESMKLVERILLRQEPDERLYQIVVVVQDAIARFDDKKPLDHRRQWMTKESL